MFHFNNSNHLSNATVEEDLFDILEQILPILTKWRALGLGLRLQPSRLEQIEVERISPRERMTRVLTVWLRGSYNMERFGLPSWRMLLNAVAHPAAGDNPALAQEIARKHQGRYVFSTYNMSLV